MKERPVLFSGEMVRALLDGRKTQTRRLVKPLDVCDRCWSEAVPHNGEAAVFGGPCYLRVSGCDHEGGTGKSGSRVTPPWDLGDRLWVREMWAHAGDRIVYRADGERDGQRWKPGIHMLRADSRIDLEVTAVRVERLHDITEADAESEGLPSIGIGVYTNGREDTRDPIKAFRWLWDAINGKRAPWASNPWLWIVSFRRVRP